MKKLFFVSLLFIAIASATFAQSLTHATVTFDIKNLGVHVQGTLGGLKGEANFNPASLATSSVEASVEVSTISTGSEKRDEHLKTDDFFDAAKYPKITLKSISFKHKNGSNYVGEFNLTIKDKTKQVEIPFTYNDGAFKGQLKINRRDYGVGGNSLIMSDDVVVTIEAGK
jgi:polyisoprenoid-binding protein YceI